MDGDPMYKTDEALSTLTDFVTDVMIQLCEGADNEQVQSFSNDTGWKDLIYVTHLQWPFQEAS